MARQDTTSALGAHPAAALGDRYVVEMPLPRVVARLNKRYTNRFIEPVVARLPGYVRVVHTGRRSGRIYRTPLLGFPANDKLLIALTYGPGADWVQNVMAGGAMVELSTGTHRVDSAVLVDRQVAWTHLPAIVRFALRLLRVTDFLLLSVAGNSER